jgi:UDP-N-acetylmuramoyl-L-alanyl-D-glutamate--2,6-diaminopimelate ligase
MKPAGWSLVAAAPASTGSAPGLEPDAGPLDLDRAWAPYTAGRAPGAGRVPALVLIRSSPVPPETRPLSHLLGSLDDAEVRGDPAVPIRDVTHRSSEVRAGSLFFCVPGMHTDGHMFATAAARAGAEAVVVERWLDVRASQVLVPSVRRAMGPVSSAFFGDPSSGLVAVGVTGTNGKTTTTYLLESIFTRAGLVPGVIGTTGVRVDHTAVPFDRTTPEAPDLQRLLFEMVGAGVRAVAMEVSSHGLDQHRVDGTRYRCAIFTNLSQDHLDYHGTMNEYFLAKARLFTPDLSERGVINADSPHGKQLLAVASVPVTTFGVEGGADLRAESVRVHQGGLAFVADGVDVESRLRGSYNVSNCLAAMAAARAVEVDDHAIAAGIAELEGVPGRLEAVESGQPFAVLVDYAHTPDSLQNVLRATRALTGGQLIVVFGCGGDRDRGKRPLMGEAATTGADLTIVTSDNPRSEDPADIIAQIEAGARAGGGAYLVEPDRRAAIRLALERARTGDVVVIAGKGHETGQEFKDRTMPFDDRIVAREELQALSPGPAR